MNLTAYRHPATYKKLRADLQAAIHAVTWVTPPRFYKWQWVEEHEDRWIDYQIHTIIKISTSSGSPVRMAVNAAFELLKAGQLIDPFLASDGETEIPANEYEITEDAAWHRAYRAIVVSYHAHAVSFWLERAGHATVKCVWHWITNAAIAQCADNLLYLNNNATLDQIKAAITLPYDRTAKWEEVSSHKWRIPGLDYFVTTTPDEHPNPQLLDADGTAEPPSWITTDEIATWYSYHPASITKAITDGRLPAIKRGHTYLVRPADVKTAVATGKMRPRQ